MGMKYIFNGLAFLLLISMVSGCEQDQVNQKKYVFLGHPYSWQNWHKIDPRLEQLDYDSYDQIWLGGDVCSQTTSKESTLDYLDSIFDLGSEKLQWTLGNHDIKFDNIDFITKRTGKNTFYTQTFDGITLLVLNTNLFWYFNAKNLVDNCEERVAQLSLIESVTDTISQSSHLIILHHHALMSELRRDASGQIPDVFNTNYESIQATCDSAFYLTEFLYPKLQKVRSRGVEVVMIGGDFGMRAKEYQFCTKDSIFLLGSGINNSLEFATAPEYVTSFDKDKILILNRDVKKKSLTWQFADLDSLLTKQAIQN
jgi:hypothetical protein